MLINLSPDALTFRRHVGGRSLNQIKVVVLILAAGKLGKTSAIAFPNMRRQKLLHGDTDAPFAREVGGGAVNSTAMMQ